MRGYRKWSARILGGVFFLSGTLKSVDPVGTSLIVTEYFKFFNLYFLIPSSWWTGFILATGEALLGAALVTGVKKRLSGILSAVLMSVFTAITLALWIRNPEMDCGCFGEAIHLTHLQSFIKNVVLDGLWLLAFIPMKNLPEAGGDKALAFGLSATCICLLSLYFAGTNPASDYTSMYPGAELFRPDDFLSEEDPVLSICNADGEYADSLAYGGRVMAASIYDPGKVRKKTWIALRSLSLASDRQGYRFLLLLPEIPEKLDRTLAAHAYTTDRKVLMTLNRSNGGVTYIHDGMIVKKWEARRLPDSYDLGIIGKQDPTELMMGAETEAVIAVQAYMLLIIFIMLIL